MSESETTTESNPTIHMNLNGLFFNPGDCDIGQASDINDNFLGLCRYLIDKKSLFGLDINELDRLDYSDFIAFGLGVYKHILAIFEKTLSEDVTGPRSISLHRTIHDVSNILWGSKTINYNPLIVNVTRYFDDLGDNGPDKLLSRIWLAESLLTTMPPGSLSAYGHFNRSLVCGDLSSLIGQTRTAYRLYYTANAEDAGVTVEDTSA